MRPTSKLKHPAVTLRIVAAQPNCCLLIFNDCAMGSMNNPKLRFPVAMVAKLIDHIVPTMTQP